MTDPPVCECHGLPCYWHKDATRTNGGRWRCRQQRVAVDAARWQDYYFDRMPATVRIRRQLTIRRLDALRRRRERQTRELTAHG